MGVEVKLVSVTTRGDTDRSSPISQLGSTGVFTRSIQQALLDEKIDVAVHSLKDLPTEPVDGLIVSAVPMRAAPGDVLVSRLADTLAGLAQNSVVATGSLRRRAQLLHVRPDLRMIDIRGNVDTRLAKLDSGQCDALILAEAGLVRLELQSRISQILPISVMLSAVGQGALGLETRRADESTKRLVAGLDDPATHAAVTAERAMLAALGAGCTAPVGGWGRHVDGKLILSAVVLSPDGRQKLECTDSGDPSVPELLGQTVAADLLRRGAGELWSES